MNAQIVALPSLAERPIVLSVPNSSGISALMKVDCAVRAAQQHKPLLDWRGLANAMAAAGFTVVGGLDSESDPAANIDITMWLYRNWDEIKSGGYSFLVKYPNNSGNELAGRTGLATNRPDLYYPGLWGRQMSFVIVLDTGEIVIPEDQVWNAAGDMVDAGAVEVPVDQFPDEAMRQMAIRRLQENGFEVRQ